jgi:hypothetical protein
MSNTSKLTCAVVVIIMGGVVAIGLNKWAGLPPCPWGPIAHSTRITRTGAGPALEVSAVNVRAWRSAEENQSLVRSDDKPGSTAVIAR